MDSRRQILEALRRNARPSPPAEPLERTLRFDDPLAAFEANLSTAGGHCRRLPGGAALAPALAGLSELAGASRLLSAVPGLASRPDPPPQEARALAGLDVAVLPGAPAVAESGAVWVVPASELERAALFLAERVVLVVPLESLVHTLHEAYAAIATAPRPFGCFVSGPSKTADIEQSLVIGAHGPRALSVALVESPSGPGDPA